MFGIASYKLGVTYRKLETRYREALQEILFEAKLKELDALRLEQYLHAKYFEFRDERIFKAGMRKGARWGGDTELYYEKAVPLLLRDLKSHIREIQKGDPRYWDRQPELKRPEIGVRKVLFEKGIYNDPKKVICLDDKTVYASASHAAQALGVSQGNLSSVCRGERNFVKGKRFAYLSDYESGNAPHTREPRTGDNAINARPVIRLEDGKVFPSLSKAANSVKASGAHIGAVCRGNRGHAGGYRWAFLDEYENGKTPLFISNQGNPDLVRDRLSGIVYPSASEAARQTGLSAATVLKHCKNRVKSPRFSYTQDLSVEVTKRRK
jgi:hypothetical protein